MDSNAYIEFLEKPFKERLKEQYDFFEQESKKGYLTGRMGSGSVDTHMPYRALDSDAFEDVLIFGSNNYLNLNNHPYVIEKVLEAVKKYGIGTGGSPAFSGYTKQHHQLEQRLAALSGHEDALLLPGGYMANLCFVNGLMTRNDILLYDKYSHASVLNAIKMTGVKFFPYDPDNLEEYERLITHIHERRASNATIFSTIEGVRSIDGTVIDLHRYVEISRRNGIVIILDDAHGLGVLGKRGWGTLEQLDLMGQVDVRMSTCSKGIGAQGAFITGDRETIFYLRSNAKPYVFTTGMAHPTVAAISAALDVLEQEPERIRRLHENVAYMQDRLEENGFVIKRGGTGIIPVFLPDGISGKFNREIYRRGVFANVMEYPMVPPGMERVRLSLMADHTHEQIDKVIEIFNEVGRLFGVPEVREQQCIG
jgi:glycine C-acetyltransferase